MSPHHGANVNKINLPSVRVVGATPGEEQAILLKLLRFFALPGVNRPILPGTRMIGSGQVSFPYLKRFDERTGARAVRAYFPW